LQMDISYINYFEHLSYLGVFLLLVAGGVLSPISEEIILIAVGYLIGVGSLNGFIAIPISIIGVFLGDSILFYLSSKGSKYIDGFMKKVPEDTLNKIEGYMKVHTNKSVFLLRFIVGLRFLGPMLAGIMKVKPNVFRTYNTLAIIIYVPLLIFIGYYFNNGLELLSAKITFIKHIAFVILISVGAFISWIIIKTKFIKSGQ